MARKEVKKIGLLTKGKKQIIAGLLEEYDIESFADIHDALSDFLVGTINGKRWNLKWKTI